MGDEAGIVAPEKRGCEMADAVGLHDLTVEGRGEKLRLGHLVVEEGREKAWVSVMSRALGGSAFSIRSR